MEYSTLEVNVISAKDINDVNLISKMDVYVVVSLLGGPTKQKVKTAVAKDCGTSPTWNYPVKFTVDPSAVKQNRLSLVFTLRSRRTLGDKDIGDVTVPLKDFLQEGSLPTQLQYLSYQVRTTSGKAKGSLNFSYKFGEKVVVDAAPAPYKGAAEPVTAYPAAVGPSGSAYPPPTYGHMPYPPPTGYAYPPPQNGGYNAYPPPQYGYPPQQPPPGYAYGAPPVVQKPAKKNKFGMGLGAGLLGGALGGMLIGDMVSDMGDYDGGFDGGFGDMGGFDF